MFAFPLSGSFWFLYIANMLLIYFPCFVWPWLILLFSDNNTGSKPRCLPRPLRGIDVSLTSSIINRVAVAPNQGLRPFPRCPDKRCLLNSCLRSSSSWDGSASHPCMKAEASAAGKRFITVYQPPSSIWAPELTHFMIPHIVSTHISLYLCGYLIPPRSHVWC